MTEVKIVKGLDFIYSEPLKPKNKKVAIVGTASPSVLQTPWNSHDIDIFALSWRQDVPRATALFDLHKIDDTREQVPENYIEWLASQKVPVFVQEVLPEVPNSVKYPLDRMIAKFGKYFASSIGFMIALAIDYGYEEIQLFGVDLLDDSEYVSQRPNAEYLLGYACGMGIKVVIPKTSALLKFERLYGYEDEPTHCGITPDMLEQSLARYREIQEEGKKQAYTADGAAQAITSMLGTMKYGKRGKVQ